MTYHDENWKQMGARVGWEECDGDVEFTWSYMVVPVPDAREDAVDIFTHMMLWGQDHESTDFRWPWGHVGDVVVDLPVPEPVPPSVGGGWRQRRAWRMYVAVGMGTSGVVAVPKPRMLYPGNDPENGPACWHYHDGWGWREVDEYTGEEDE